VSSDVRRIDPPKVAGDDLVGAEVDLAADVGAVSLSSPVLSASGCFASGAEIDRFHDVRRLGAVVVKSVTPEPREGLPTPRMTETASGMLNAIGLQNPGIDAWMARDLAWLQDRDIPTVVSIAGKSVEEFAAVARKLRRARNVVAIEVNLSCPNVEHRGLVFACDPKGSADVIAAVRREADVPVWGKLTSDVTDVVAVARAVV
jgi:dihydroorotate dehydrogenase (NAD+) catalytic subunit